MGVLRIVESGKDQQGKPWWQDRGKASNLAVGEAILEKIAGNYEKGCFLQVQEKKDKKNLTHKTVSTDGDKDKATVESVTEIWQRKKSDQTEVDPDNDGFIWHWVATLKSPLDAKKSMAGIAAITPNNSILVMGGVDDNQDWQEGPQMEGKAKATEGGLNADEAPETPKKVKGEAHYPVKTKLSAVK